MTMLDSRRSLAALSNRELEVLAEVARARSNAAIAASLFISERSVEKHIAAILMKLGIAEDGTTNRRVAAALTYLSTVHPLSDAG
jgi:DNA-binding NarL/FixJ family response regulator